MLDQRARLARRPHRVRAARRPRSVRSGQPDGRGGRLRRGDRAEGDAADPDHDAREPRGRPRRAAADLPPAVVPLGADRLARDAHDPGARRRRPAPGRGAAHPPARAPPRGSRAGRVALLGAMVGGSLDRAMDVAATLEVRGFADRPPRAARARGRGRATTSPSLASAAGDPRRSPLLARARPGRRASTPTRWCTLPVGAAHVRAVRRAARGRRCCRSATAGGSTDERAAARLRAGHLPLPGRRARRRSSDVSLELQPGEFCLLAGLSGHGKSTLLRAACGLVPHFHGGRFAGRVHARGPRHARARARAPRARSRACCSRTPRRSS